MGRSVIRCKLYGPVKLDLSSIVLLVLLKGTPKFDPPAIVRGSQTHRSLKGGYRINSAAAGKDTRGRVGGRKPRRDIGNGRRARIVGGRERRKHVADLPSSGKPDKDQRKPDSDDQYKADREAS